MSETKTERPIGKIHSTTIMSIHGNIFIFYSKSNVLSGIFNFRKNNNSGLFVAMKTRECKRLLHN